MMAGRALWLAAVWLLSSTTALGGQSTAIRLSLLSGATATVPVLQHRGYAVVPLSALESIGWRVIARGPDWRLAPEGGPELELSEGSPFFRLGEARLQLVGAPYAQDAQLYVPVQLLLDVLPSTLPDRYAADDQSTLRVLEATGRGRGPVGRAAQGRATSARAPSGRAAAAESGRAPAAAEPARRAGSEKLVVVIDPGHGGEDPGAIGPGGVREKDVALAIGIALARELAKRPEMEVHLTRDSDVLVPLWDRGGRATGVKGDRRAIFLSLHANAQPRQRAVRGFETYFLSEARTDDERRVAANENAPLAIPRDASQGADPDLEFILRELRNLDHQHWSSLLAQLVQAGLDPVHPGTNRGVKQGPFAVITNALMPSVLIEVGFITNREEERLLASSEFQDSVAKALAGAVGKFFERYPAKAAPGVSR
jgi:N-acetylmuramoyl-L-alanine amidase